MSEGHVGEGVPGSSETPRSGGRGWGGVWRERCHPRFPGMSKIRKENSEAIRSGRVSVLHKLRCQGGVQKRLCPAGVLLLVDLCPPLSQNIHALLSIKLH